MSTPELSKDMLREITFSTGIVARRIAEEMAAFEQAVAGIVARAQAKKYIRSSVTRGRRTYSVQPAPDRNPSLHESEKT